MADKFKNPWLMHSWGKSPEQKAKEKAYNHEYYLKNRNKWKTIYNDTQSQFGSKVDELNRSISGAEARVSATKDAYDKSVAEYRKGLSDYQSFLGSIPKVGSERTSEQNRMLEDRQNKMRELKSAVDKTEQTYRNAQNDLKSQMKDRDSSQRQIERMRQRAERAESDYNNYENSEAGESERYRREMNALRTRRNKNEEAIQKRWSNYDKESKNLKREEDKTAYNLSRYANPKNASEAQALAAARSRAKKLANDRSNLDKQAALDPGMTEYRQRNADRSETADQMRALASKRRASAMARTMQAHQQQTQSNRQAFQKQQSNVEQQANKDLSMQKTRANKIQNQMKATQDRVSNLMDDLNDGLSKGYDRSNKTMQNIAAQIQKEQNLLAQQRQQLNTVNTAIKTLEKKAKQAHSNI